MTYPPEHHFLRDLRIETVQTGEHSGRCLAPVTDFLRNRAGAVGLGVIVTVADIAASSAALVAVAPDWQATLDLSVTMTAPLTDGPIIVDSRLLRGGKKVVVLAVDVFDGHGGEGPAAEDRIGRGTVSFSRLPISASAIRIDRRR